MSTEEEPWVVQYNAILTEVAKEYGDVLLDWNTLSHKYVDHFNFAETGLYTHSDAMHYCAGGLPRVASLLLQDILVENIGA